MTIMTANNDKTLSFTPKLFSKAKLELLGQISPAQKKCFIHFCPNLKSKSAF